MAPDRLPSIQGWYARHGRHSLPWRLTRDPYAVLVSEVMLQQTRVSRVLPAFPAWLTRWPTVHDLAAASAADVIRAWVGLGYNRRALNLHRAAVQVVASGLETVPVEPADLSALPGVGRYTASAVASFAGALPVPVVDTNVGRVLARHSLGVSSVRDVPSSALWGLAAAALPLEGEAARAHNLALMDLGALVCQPARPQCDSCPLTGGCRWRAAGMPPGVGARPPAPPFETTARFARGRIVAALRRGPLASDAVAAVLPPRHAVVIEDLLAGLQRDGLVACLPDGRYSLPGDPQGSTSIASPKL